MISNLSKNRIFQNINLDRQEIHGAVMWFSMTEFIPETDYPPTTNETGRSWGRIQNMDPRSMDHPCGLGPWNPSWTRSMDYPRGTTSPPPPPIPHFVNSILGFHMTSRPPCWCPKQRKGGHVGAPTKSSGNLTILLCKRFLLFSLKNMAVDHVSENQQYVVQAFGSY